MKLGERTYTQQEAVIIDVYKAHIQKLQKEIDEHWNMLVEQINSGRKKQHDDYLWDYVMNDFYS